MHPKVLSQILVASGLSGLAAAQTPDRGTGFTVSGTAVLNATGLTSFTPLQFTNSTTPPGNWTLSAAVGTVNDTRNSNRTNLVQRFWFESPDGTFASGVQNNIAINRDVCITMFSHANVTPLKGAGGVNGTLTKNGGCAELIGDKCMQSLSTWGNGAVTTDANGTVTCKTPDLKALKDLMDKDCKGTFEFNDKRQYGILTTQLLSIKAYNASQFNSSEIINPDTFIHGAFHEGFYGADSFEAPTSTNQTTVYNELVPGGQVALLTYGPEAGASGGKSQPVCAMYNKAFGPGNTTSEIKPKKNSASGQLKVGQASLSIMVVAVVGLMFL